MAATRHSLLGTDFMVSAHRLDLAAVAGLSAHSPVSLERASSHAPGGVWSRCLDRSATTLTAAPSGLVWIAVIGLVLAIQGAAPTDE